MGRPHYISPFFGRVFFYAHFRLARVAPESRRTPGLLPADYIFPENHAEVIKVSKLLFDSQPLVVDPELARVIGLNEAIVLQQIHYWVVINQKAGRNFHEGYHWTYNTYKAWQEQFPFWSVATIKRIISNLQRQNLIAVGCHNKLKIDRTKWYRVNYETLKTLVISPLCQNEPMESIKLTPPLPETSSETTLKPYNYNSPLSALKDLPDTGGHGKDIVEAIHYYLRRYKKHLGREHPQLKTEQWERVYCEVLFVAREWALSKSDWEQMIDRHFENNLDTDYNINHFATKGILTNTMYQSVYAS